MIAKEKGYRYKDLHLYNQLKHQPYDYERNGLLVRLLPKVITDTENETTQFILKSIECIFVFLMKQVDDLKHFKNFNHNINL